jgi:hypothetical protein
MTKHCDACPKPARREVWLALFGGPGRTFALCDAHAAALQGAGFRQVVDALEWRLESRTCGICGSPAEGFVTRPVRIARKDVLLAAFLCGPCLARRDLDQRLHDAASQR